MRNNGKRSSFFFSFSFFLKISSGMRKFWMAYFLKIFLDFLLPNFFFNFFYFIIFVFYEYILGLLICVNFNKKIF